jgi:UDP-3-O-[3-hydroxymyristoyl] glucosamine N-acyltransferase
VSSLISVTSILDILGRDDCTVMGDMSAVANAPAPLLHGAEMGFSFHDSLRFPDIRAVLKDSRSTIILTDHSGPIPFELEGRALILVAHPRTSFVKVLDRLEGKLISKGQVHAAAIISTLSHIHPEAYVGPGCIIGRADIGKGSILEANVTIGDGVRVGEEVRIKPGAVIGGDGYSYERDDDGHLMRFPHFGGVVIEDHVDIGANTVIDRGTFGNTTIGRGTKIDNLCHIAHNVRIGQDCLIIAHSTLSGSDVIGNRVWVAPGAMIKDGVSIGDDAFIGMGAVVVQDVPARATMFGNPARQLPEGKPGIKR